MSPASHRPHPPPVPSACPRGPLYNTWGPSAPSRKARASVPASSLQAPPQRPENSTNNLRTAHRPFSGPLCLPTPWASQVRSPEPLGFPSDLQAPQCPLWLPEPQVDPSRSWGLPALLQVPPQQPLKPAVPRRDPRAARYTSKPRTPHRPPEPWGSCRPTAGRVSPARALRARACTEANATAAAAAATTGLRHLTAARSSDGKPRACPEN